MARILLVEDEPDLQQLMRYNLEREGHAVTVAGTGNDALHELRRSGYDLILLDLMLPDRDGLEICRIVRADPATSRIPIIIVTAKGDESDVVLGLGLGADDYVAKPFRVKELLARVKVRLGRSRMGASDSATAPIERHGMIIDPRKYSVAIAGTPVTLTLTEFKLLHVLAAASGAVFARYDLIDKISDGENVVTDRTIDVHVRNLRRKLGDHQWVVETVRGVGYRFADAPDSAAAV